MPRRAEHISDRLHKKIILDEAGCWIWQGAIAASGYGRIAMPNGSAGGTRAFVHRVAYQAWVGPIPDEFTIDHLCRNRACCNPEHLEAVERSENLRRMPQSVTNREKTHCRHGHEFTAENTRIVPKGRRCRECERRRARESDQRKRATAS